MKHKRNVMTGTEYPTTVPLGPGKPIKMAEVYDATCRGFVSENRHVLSYFRHIIW